jgi:photosystem II stability/assembly factor-like uncharacterized protein
VRTLFYLFFLLVPLLSEAQSKPVPGKDFFAYTKAMDEYYAHRERGKGSGYKQYRRWRHHISYKAGYEGKLMNFEYLDLQALDKVRMHQPAVPSRQTHGYWEDLGPHDYYTSDSYSGSALGRINCLAFHPTNPNTLFAGGAIGGLWKTTNHGDTWQCITNNFPSISIADVVVHPTNPDIIYILTGSAEGFQATSIGVLKTIDGGITWKPTGLTFDVDNLAYGFCLRMHPVWHDVLLAGFDNDGTGVGTTLYITYDGGATWQSRITNNTVYDLEFKPGDIYTIYAATFLGVYRSTNGGGNFYPSNSGIPMDSVRLAIAVTPDEPENLFVLIGAVPSSGTFGGLCRSTDSGLSYAIMSTTPNILGRDMLGGGTDQQISWDHCITADPANANRIFVGAINGWKSDDAGVNWSRETWFRREFGAVDPYVHADWHNVYFKGSRIYSANDGGIFYSDDYGHSWSEISSGLGVTQFYNIDIHNGEYIGGTQDNGTNEDNIGGDLQMHNIHGGDGFGCTWHNADQTIKIISSQDDIVRRQFGSNLYIYQETDKFWFNDLKMATNVDHVFAVKAGTNLIRGHQNAFPHDWSWYETGTIPFSDGFINGFRQGVNDPAIMYVASEFMLLKSTSIYTLPTAPWDTLPHPDAGLYYAELAVDSFNANILWVVCGGYTAGKKVYKSVDGGMTWTNISGSLPNIPMRCIEAKTSGTDELYVGTEIGVFYWNEIINDWIYFSNALPSVPVYDLELNEDYVYAGTFGRGIWRSEIYTPCPGAIALTLSDPYSPYTPGTQVYSAEYYISSNRIYSGSLGTTIYYHAGDYIDLTEGFWAKDGTFFQADLEGCPD